MKTKFLNTIGILAIALSAGTATAQTLTVPNTFSYQAVITKEDGTPVADHDITVEVSIKQGSGCETNPDACQTLWQELHSPRTTSFGSFSINIGDPDAINTTGGTLDKYSDIKWLDTNNGQYYMQVRVDFGEATYLNGMTDLGTTRFSAVPYALAATSAESAKTAESVQPVNGKIGNKFAELSDVAITEPKANQILVYDATLQAWKNTDPAAAQGLTNINISSPKTGDHLVYNETNGKWENKTIATPKLSDLSDVKNMTSITAGDILYYNYTDKVWENKTLKLNTIQDVNTTGAKNGQVLTYNGNFWEAQDAATGSEAETELSKLTDVTITSPANGNTLQYQDGKWINAATSASDLWLADNDKNIYSNTKYGNVGIGTGSNAPAALLHIKDGTNNTLFNARGITVGGSKNRTTNTASIALGNGDEGDVPGTAVIAGVGSTCNTDAKNSIIMGNKASGIAECDIVIGDESKASADHCALFGKGLITNKDYQYIFGKYNKRIPYSDDNFIFVVANGTGTSDDNTLNIFTIDKEGNVTAKDFIKSSDMRLKTNINTMTGALDNVLKLRGVTFNWKETSNNSLQYGFIAQEMEKVFPDLVGTDSNGFKTINYSGVIPVLTEAIKTQQEEIESLKSENEQLKSTLEQLLKRVEALENR